MIPSGHYSPEPIPPEGTRFAGAIPDPGDIAEERWDVKQWCIDLALGIVVTLLGIAGLVLPILPGWVAIIGGILLLAVHVPPLRRLVTRLIMTDRVQRLLDKLAAHRRTQKLMTKALLRTQLRDAVEPVARLQLVHILARRAAEHRHPTE